MKRFLKIAAVLVFAAAFFVSPAQAGYDHYTINVYKDVGYRSGSFGYVPVTSGVQYVVLYNGGLNYCTMTTVYSDAGLTSLTNPIHAENFDAEGKIDFYMDDGDGSTVDLLIIDNDGGYSLYMNDVTPSCHSAIIDERPGMEHHGQIWFHLHTDPQWYAASTVAANAEWDTGIDFHAMTMIHKVIAEMVVPAQDSADTTLSVGFASNEVGFLIDSVVDAHGMIDVVWSATCTYGQLLFSASCVEEHGDGVGTNIPNSYILREAGSLNYTISSADTTKNTAAESGWGFIHYFFTPLRR